MDKGSIIAEGAPWELCEEINGKVFEITAEEKDIPELEKDFKVGDMVKERDGIRVRIVSDRVPYGYEYVEKEPDLEDVYLYRV